MKGSDDMVTNGSGDNNTEADVNAFSQQFPHVLLILPRNEHTNFQRK